MQSNTVFFKSLVYGKKMLFRTFDTYIIHHKSYIKNQISRIISYIIYCLLMRTCMKRDYTCYAYIDTWSTIIDTESTLSHLMSRGMPIYFHPLIGHGWMCTAKFLTENVAKSNDLFCIGNADLIATKKKMHLTCTLSGGIWQIFGSGTDIGMFATSADEVWKCKQKLVRGTTSLPWSLDGHFGRKKLAITAQHSPNVKCCDDDHFKKKSVVPKSLPRPIQTGGGTKHFPYCSLGAQRHHRVKLRDYPPPSHWDNSTPIYTNSCEWFWPRMPQNSNRTLNIKFSRQNNINAIACGKVARVSVVSLSYHTSRERTPSCLTCFFLFFVSVAMHHKPNVLPTCMERDSVPSAWNVPLPFRREGYWMHPEELIASTHILCNSLAF